MIHGNASGKLHRKYLYRKYKGLSINSNTISQSARSLRTRLVWCYRENSMKLSGQIETATQAEGKLKRNKNSSQDFL